MNKLLVHHARLLLLHHNRVSLRWHGHLMLHLLHLLLLGGLGLRPWIVIVHDGLLHLLLRLWHAKKWVHVLRIHQVIFDNIIVHRRHTELLNPTLTLEEVEALVLQILQESLLLLTPKVNLLLLLRVAGTHALLLLKLLGEGAFLSLSSRIRPYIASTEVVKHLAWNFLQSLLGQRHGVIGKLSERHELDNIGSHLLSVDLRVERSFVSVELVHSAEISIANTNDNDRKRKLRTVNDLIDSLLKVANDTISND